MAKESLEQRVEKLEKTIKSLEETNKNLSREIERLQAIKEIQNLQSKSQYLHMANRNSEIVELFAKKTPGVRITLGELGSWEGPDAAKRVYSILPSGSIPGMMALHALSNAYIEVAADGKTAKGIWLGSGFLATVNRETGEPWAGYEYDKYGIDFVKEDGQWKFWHYHIYRLLHEPAWGEPWAKQFSEEQTSMPVPDELKSDKPTAAGDDNPYRPDTAQRLVPKPPEPYETFDEKTAY